jgi:hypothetical protein
MTHSLTAHRAAATVVFLGTSCLLPLVRFDQQLVPRGPLVCGLIALAVALLPEARAYPARAIRRLAALKGRERAWAAVVAGVTCAVVIGLLALAQRTTPFLTWHDEFQFHLQSQMLARFRLWMPPHPLADFFDTFYVLMTPKYAPQSFPGRRCCSCRRCGWGCRRGSCRWW